MSRKWIDFEVVYPLASIEQLSEMLNLPVQKRNQQLRCACPVHGGDDTTLAITPNVRSRKGKLGVFFCHKSEEGGDSIALVAHCLELGQQEAAFFISDHFGENRTVEGTGTLDSTVSKSHAKPAPDPTSQASHGFNPVAFAAKLQYEEASTRLGISEADARSIGIGFHRGKLYQALRWPNGDVAGFSSISFTDGEFKLPTKLVPMSTNIVKFPKTA